MSYSTRHERALGRITTALAVQLVQKEADMREVKLSLGQMKFATEEVLGFTGALVHRITRVGPTGPGFGEENE